MDGAEFAKKFRLIQVAAERAGKTLADKTIARDIFLTHGEIDERSENVAKVAWNHWKHGRRPFDDGQLEALWSAVNRQVCGLLKDIAPDELYLPFAQFQHRFAAVGIIHRGDLAPGPALHELLHNLNSSDAVIEFLKGRDHTIAWSTRFKEAFDLVPGDQDRLIHLFHEAVEQCMGVRGRARTLALASGTLTYVWDAFTGRPEIEQLSNRLEDRVAELEPHMVLMVEPLSYIATLHGHHGPYIRNIERMITDPHWRRVDFKERLHYCAVIEGKPLPTALARRVAVARNIARHLRTHRDLSEILCQDVGRVIEVYPALAKFKRHRPLAEEIKEGILARVANADISRTLRARAEDLIEGRRA